MYMQTVRVVEFVEDPAEEVSLVEAQKQNTNAEVGDILKVPVHSVQIWPYCNTECKECHSSENP